MRQVLLATLLCTSTAIAPAADRPNVVLIISDDAGWADYGFMRAAVPAANPGSRGAVPTPNLDRLAGRGVAFTNAYTASVCSPSRAMITTGQYGTRFGYGSNIQGSTTSINNATTVQGLPTEAITVWERMQSVGYDTAAVGKWHIGEHANGGGQLGNRPENQGVQHFEGLWGGSRGYFVDGATGSQALRRTISDGAGSIASNAIVEGDYNGQYVTDVFGDQSADYIRDKATSDSAPFFLYSSFTAPHTPMQATTADLAVIDSMNEPGFTGQRRTYAAMQYAMDRNVGKILDALDDPNGDGNQSDSVADNTLLLFINDNGGDCCDSSPNSSSNGGLRNGKGSQFEGGLRVPMIVAGAGVDAGVQGSVSLDLVHAIDLVPTAFSGAGGGAFTDDDVIDGVNLLPYINGETSGVAHEDLFISRSNNQQSAVRKGPWKYMYQNGTGYQLYNLDTNPNESNNVIDSAANAAIVDDLHQVLASYHVQMDKPRHDNQAPLTNQFDHFRFREDGLSNAAFSSADAWVNGDNPSGARTATWRDGYADNRMTFRAKTSGSYTVTNDLKSGGGFAYMANRITLASSEAVLVGENSVKLDGLPILLTANRSGEGPLVDLDAMDSRAGAFTFEVGMDLEVYDDLTIQGDGNQRFLFTGKVREFRPGRSVTKVGDAEVTFAGGVDLTGSLTMRAGKVAFTNGNVRGNLVAQAGSTVQIGEVGITRVDDGGTAVTPLEIVATGLDLNYDAGLDPSGDSLWLDSAGNANSVSFAAASSSVAVDSSAFPNLVAAYSIPSSGGASGLNSYFEGTGPRSRLDGSFEVVFKVTDTVAGADQVLFEAGGQARGVAMVVNDGTLTFNVDGDAEDINLSAPLTEGWHHAVGVVDLESDSDSISLYLNNQLVGTVSGQTIDDWAGGNLFGLGAGASSVTGVSSGAGQAFHGDIAVTRFYTDNAFGTAEVDQNYQWLLQDIDPVTGDPAVTLAIDGDFSLEAGSFLTLDLLSVSAFDRLEATGQLLLEGSLMVAASEGFEPAAGEVFQVASGASRAGEFESTDLPDLPDGLMWQVVYTPNNVSLSVTIAGDYNGDGVIDAADYTVWRDANGQEIDPGVGADGNGDGMVNDADLSIWQQNYGMSIASAVAANSVPEPTTVSAVALGSLLVAAGVKR